MKFMRLGESVESNIFNILNTKKREMAARGVDVIDLSIGTPDFEPSAHVMQAVAEAASKPENYKYSLRNTDGLTAAVQRWYSRRYGVQLEADEIMSVSGSQEGIAHVCFPFCRPGDLVLAPDPGYPIFTFGPMMAGCEIGLYPLRAENNWVLDFADIPDEVADRAKIMIVSYPNNPTGVAADEDFYVKLVEFARAHDIIVLHDNAYSDLMFDGRRGISFLSIPGAKEIGCEFNSLSKTYNLTGMRVSFLVGNRDVVQKFFAFRSQIDYGMFFPAQIGAQAALDGPQELVEQNRAGYEARRNALCGGLRSIGWDVPDTAGTMFVWARIPEKFKTSADFVLEMMDKTGVICVPGTSFGELGEGYVRFALTAPAARMEEVVRRIGASDLLR